MGASSATSTTVREPLKFASFVSVICKRALLNHRARRRDVVEPDDYYLPATEVRGADVYDGQLVLRVIEAALDALPEAIRGIARMRLLERRDYEWIAEKTDRPIATVRTYVSKALVHLRANERLRSLRFDDLVPPLPEDEDPAAP